MKQTFWYAPGEIRTEEVPVPEIDDDSLLVKNRVSLTCGSDVKEYKRGYPGFVPGQPLGHEFAGDVVEVGKKIEGFRPGDRVMTMNTAACGNCFFCKTGRDDGSCQHMVKISGGFAEYVKVPGAIVRQNMFHIPDDISYQAAALLEPLSCSAYTADMVPVRLGDTVCVIGAGPCGLMIAKMLKMRGCRVIQADLSAERLEASRKMGIDVQINFTGCGDPVGAVRALTPEGMGPDSVVEATGFPEVWETAINMVRKCGYVSLFGGCKSGTTITIDTGRIHYDGITIQGFYHTTSRHVLMARDLILAKAFDENLLITRQMPYERLQEALELHYRQDGLKNAILYD